MTGPVERVPLTDEHLLELQTLWLGPDGTGRVAESLSPAELASFGRIALEDVPGLLDELRASRAREADLAAELSVLRPALRAAKRRIGKALEVCGLGVTALLAEPATPAKKRVSVPKVRAALTGTEDGK